jgi:hypothetical protein
VLPPTSGRVQTRTCPQEPIPLRPSDIRQGSAAEHRTRTHTCRCWLPQCSGQDSHPICHRCQCHGSHHVHPIPGQCTTRSRSPHSQPSQKQRSPTNSPLLLVTLVQPIPRLCRFQRVRARRQSMYKRYSIRDDERFFSHANS